MCFWLHQSAFELPPLHSRRQVTISIKNVQNALKELGYYAGDINGSLGVNTRNALTAYQQAYGLDATGVVDEATVRALGLI